MNRFNCMTWNAFIIGTNTEIATGLAILIGCCSRARTHLTLFLEVQLSSVMPLQESASLEKPLLAIASSKPHINPVTARAKMARFVRLVCCCPTLSSLLTHLRRNLIQDSTQDR